MGVQVHLPAPMRKLTGGQAEVTAAGATISELIDALESRYQGIREQLLDEAGAVRRFVNFYVNDEDVRFLEGKDTRLKDGDKVVVLPAGAGGRG